ncbi:MAG TPA: deoxyguanosinetriphosphate triphosphohydrolase [Bryobacteraceae bacterium]|nr:deoxyguanosinetriphosphate triphosphohydrolase [Bryobacteraceae bacterium]
MLGRLRLGTQALRGRRYPEALHPYRTDFQRDRDRIIHSRSFRRLEGKTQVFAPGLSDHFRNRLTHTIEVSQIARTVAVALELNEEYTETLALAHDLGHPPFGHSGEKALDRQMRVFGSSFEHNRHALRIVDTLEQRYARFDGLNLTFEVREGIIKHSREIEPGVDAELDELLPGRRPPLEAQLIDIADEIAYNTADLDDGFSSGLLSVSDIAGEVPLFAQLAEQAEMQFPGASERLRFWECQRQLINVLVGGLIEGTAAAAKEAGVQDSEDVRQCTHRLAKMTPESRQINGQIKQLLTRRLYSLERLTQERDLASKKIGELFELLIAVPDRLPSAYREQLLEQRVERVVCDYIAGMTDAYFLRVYNENAES